MCKVWFNGDNIGRTTVVKKSLNPVWDGEFFDIALPDEIGPCTLTVEVWDHDTIGSGSFLGAVRLEGLDLVRQSEDRTLFPLEPLDLPDKPECKDSSLVQGRYSKIFILRFRDLKVLFLFQLDCTDTWLS